jgi:hypothetical protein
MMPQPATLMEEDGADAVSSAASGNGNVMLPMLKASRPVRVQGRSSPPATLPSCNLIASLVLAAGLQLMLFPAYGLFSPVAQSLKAGAWFTLLFLVRRQSFGFLSQRPPRGHAK